MRVLEYNGQIHSIAEWANKLGIKRITLYKRLTTMSPEQALSFTFASTERRNSRITVTYQKETHTLTEWVKITGIHYSTLYARYLAGKPLDASRNYRVRRLTFNGVTLPLVEWATRLGITRVAMYLRLKTMTLEEALTLPKRTVGTSRSQHKGQQIEYGGTARTIKEWARHIGLSTDGLRRRLRLMSVAAALTRKRYKRQ